VTEGPTVEIFGVAFTPLDPGSALVAIERLHDAEAPGFVAHVNAHTLNLACSDPGYRATLARADLVLNDGKGVMIAARLRGRRFPADLNGNFMSPKVLELAAARGWSVYFLGGRPGIARRAAQRLAQRLPNLDVAGARDGYFPESEDAEVAAAIGATGASVVMVGLGNPRQERWLARRLPETGARLGIGVGAFLDFQAGAVPRAPEWMNRAGLEWAHRLAQEPGRLWRRYLLGHPQFLARVALEAGRERLAPRR
jgi:N-acetylglucosaminyldiphosphoundecaprenol N-acetyl-beta-D-mannosaminyltransferase